ncbi:cold shock domain-containing protein [Angustibacter sp. Root456]|uniref:cold shock domain-containing protein n=1 Tax=Angustibacter sp. Root456 TaxID=1736539 RepID=UPI0012FBD066|nr:cold shock domain-containing protein [Angustibacter sp. Root456]
MTEDLTGTVASWSEDAGWGVLASDATPGGCFASFAVVHIDGYRALTVGRKVTFSAIPMEIEGLRWQATSVTPIEPN